MGMGSIHVSSPDRRDRLWLLNAFAIVLLTLLGVTGGYIGGVGFPAPGGRNPLLRKFLPLP